MHNLRRRAADPCLPCQCTGSGDIRNVEGRQQAAGAQVTINQIDTSAFPKVTMFAVVSKNGVPLKGLSSPISAFARRGRSGALTVVPKLTPLNAVIASIPAVR